MNKQDINQTTLELLKLNQLQEQYISFLELAIDEPQGIALIHGWTPNPKTIETGKNIREGIKQLKEILGYEETKKSILNN